MKASLCGLLLGSAILASCCLLVMSADCKMPPETHQYAGTAKECLAEHKGNQLCWLQCFAEKLGMVDKEGTPNPEKIDACLDTLEDGGLKEAMKKAKKRCLNKKIDVTKSHCQGYLNVGLCIRNVMKKHCPELMKSLAQ